MTGHPHEPAFDALMDQLRAGGDAAAAEVLGRYGRRLAALARARLGPRLRPKVDPEDVLQSVYRSFFTRCRDGRLRADGWDGLWGVLAVMTLRKCVSRAEHFAAARRDARQEVRLGGADAAAREPTPDEAAALADLVDRLMAGFEPRDRDALALHLAGHTIDEVAAGVGCARRTVRRTLERARLRLRRLADDRDA